MPEGEVIFGDKRSECRGAGKTTMPPEKRAAKRRSQSCDNRPRKFATGVSVSNAFSLLSSERANRPRGNDNNVKRVVKPAPITVTDKKIDFAQFLGKTKINYRFKILGIGTKVFCDSEDGRNEVVKLLKDNNVEYYSHPYGDQKLFKVILSGLPEIETDMISDSLKKQNNVKPVNISLLKSAGSSKLYLLQFKRGEVSRTDLNNVKVVYNHIVKWLPFKPRRRGPTQCYKCGMYGHGATFCCRKTSCLLCGEEHMSNVCPLETREDTSPHVVYKCINCAQLNLPANHKASDDACPARQNYISIRGRANSRKNNAKTERNLNRNDVRRTDANASVNVSYAEALKRGNSTFSHRTENENVNNLWSFTEVSELLLQSIDELSKCHTKFDQLKVIANLLQHACK